MIHNSSLTHHNVTTKSIIFIRKNCVSNGKENLKMFENYESEDSGDYDDPNYWLQMKDEQLDFLDYDDVVRGKKMVSEFRIFDDVAMSYSGATTFSDAPSYWLKTGDGNMREFAVENPEDVRPEDYQILNEEVIYTPELNSEDVDVIWMGKKAEIPVWIQRTPYPVTPPPREDHTYSKPHPRDVRILETIDDVIHRYGFRRHRRDAMNPPSPRSLLGHVSRRAEPYTRKLPTKSEPSMIERWINWKCEPPKKQILNHHRFSNVLLCQLACRNAPNGMVTSNCVVNFILHHFPYYRFDPKFTRSIRTALNRRNNFESIPVLGRSRVMYSPVHPDIHISPDNWDAMDMDPRGRAFFEQMLRGELGLPRQLFYHIIAQNCPQLAGPENSALFYNLLSIGHIPKPGSAHFKIHVDPCRAVEPRFDEPIEFYPANRWVLGIREFSFFGINRLRFEDNVDVGYSGRFFRNIRKYFETQKAWKLNGLGQWETPFADY